MGHEGSLQQPIRGRNLTSLQQSDSRCCLWEREGLVKKSAQKKDMGVQETFNVHLHILGGKDTNFLHFILF